MNILNRFGFQNRGRFGDLKRTDDLEEAFASGFLHAGPGIDRNRFLLPASSGGPGPIFKLSDENYESKDNTDVKSVDRHNEDTDGSQPKGSSQRLELEREFRKNLAKGVDCTAFNLEKEKVSANDNETGRDKMMNNSKDRYSTESLSIS